MRAAAIGLGLSVALAAGGAGAMTALPGAARQAANAPVTRVGYYCSPGFEATYGGRCEATASRDEIDLYLNEAPAYAEPAPVRRHRTRRKGLRSRY